MVVSDLNDVRSNKSVVDPTCLRFTSTFFVSLFFVWGAGVGGGRVLFFVVLICCSSCFSSLPRVRELLGR